MTKKQKDKAFIDKLKTLQFSTGKGGEEAEPVCDKCGGTFTEHIYNGLKQFVSSVESGMERRKKSESEEESFSA